MTHPMSRIGTTQPRNLPGRNLVTDTDGNRYDIRDLSTPDNASRTCFLRHL